MKFYVNLAIFFIALAGISCVSVPNEDPSTLFPTPTTRATIPTTEAHKKTTTEAPKPTTAAPSTTEAPVTTTAAPVTTTAAPTSTTAAPTTSSTTVAPTTSSTTVAPTTSTTPVPTTTAAPPTPPTPPTPPSPPAPPTTGKWSYSDKKRNETCLIIQMAAQLNLTYTTTDNKTANVLYNIPVNGTSIQAGDCGNGTSNQSITLEWGEKPVSTAVLLFNLNATTKLVSLGELVFGINAATLPKGNNETLKFFHSVDEFGVPQAKSYHCTRVQKLTLTSDEKSNSTIGWALLSHVQFEAFHKSNDATFSSGKDCDAKTDSDAVPIFVGCALALLVVVVLIAYLVGRRRAQARGYVSM